MSHKPRTPSQTCVISIRTPYGGNTVRHEFVGDHIGVSPMALAAWLDMLHDRCWITDIRIGGLK
ncbi:hypothetical protein [Bifidobacterium scaligerum]|uniref:Uncharacterized protein n=1 Tax=Bifidobacterium scaligerum TaxID=2052656 RepID=A0A2M9HT46_9BIFI|nr:hypothetical protein [Bifidobacterium scaligerum]PJM79981.1 hypothetical protein CUU80_02275 [Bifidobacterium scaligerum]